MIQTIFGISTETLLGYAVLLSVFATLLVLPLYAIVLLRRVLKVQACILRALGPSTRPAEGKVISLTGRRRSS